MSDQERIEKFLDEAVPKVGEYISSLALEFARDHSEDVLVAIWMITVRLAAACIHTTHTDRGLSLPSCLKAFTEVLVRVGNDFHGWGMKVLAFEEDDSGGTAH